MVDTRLGGCPQFFVGEPEELMTLPEEITKSAALICWKGGANFSVAGTGFFLSLPTDFPKKGTAAAIYLVTAAHVIEGVRKRRKRDVYLIANPLEGLRRACPIRISDWYFHSSPEVDVAVTPIWDSEASWPFDHTHIPYGMALGENVVKMKAFEKARTYCNRHILQAFW
jgi:hypothetical protein